MRRAKHCVYAIMATAMARLGEAHSFYVLFIMHEDSRTRK